LGDKADGVGFGGIDRAKPEFAQRSLVASRRLIDADEPLLGAAKDDGRLAAPVVRIAVRELVVVEKMAAVAQRLDDKLVGLPDVDAAEERGDGVVVRAGTLHGTISGKATRLAG